jgi:ABC-type uncharacterized transport system permease subunit
VSGAALNLFAGAGSMIETAAAIALVAGGIGAILAGIAAMRIGDAWKIWATRCDPKNKNFRPPVVGKKR